MTLAVSAAAFVIALVAWGVVRLIRGRAAIREALQRDGCTVLGMERRALSLGPFAGTTSRSQIAYRVRVRDRDGRDRIVWARWGRTWLPADDAVDLQWENDR